MSKKEKVKEVRAVEVPVKEKRSYRVTQANLVDGMVNYTYEITSGIGTGNIHKVKGKGLYEDDLTEAFNKLAVHLAAIDDVFKYAKVEGSLSFLRKHELSREYMVDGIILKGEEDQKMVVLIGTKSIQCSGDRMDLKTPSIPMDKLSSYDYKTDLNNTVETLLEEVELYHEGKCTIPEPEEQEDPNQLSLADGMDDDDFEDGKV